MKILISYHFQERISERVAKEEAFIIETFKYLLKLVRRKRLKIEKSKTHPDRYVIRYQEFKYVFAKAE